MKIVVVAPDYDQNSGGSVCLHELAHTLKLMGVDVYIAPMISTSPNFFIETYQKLKSIFLKVKTKEGRKVSVLTYWRARRYAKYGGIYIYPEVVLGNPYGANRIIRWLLHRPMHFNRILKWNAGDVVVRYDSVIERINFPDIFCMSSFLKIASYPIDLYKSKNIRDKKGVAYSVRKGKGGRLFGDEDVSIDGLDHNEVAEILGRVKYFYSLDLYSAYSKLAVLAGAISIVVPDPSVSIDDWYPDKMDRLGIAYGEAEIEWALSTKEILIERMRSYEVSNVESCQSFLEELKITCFNDGTPPNQ